MPPATDNVLEIRGLCAGYGETTIVRDLDLDVRRGETLVIVGPNGHGKTTLLRAISGLATIAAGSIVLDGERIERTRTEALAERGLVHIPQGDLLFPDLTIEENLLIGAFPRSSWAQRAPALERVYTLFPHLHERRDQRTRTLSGGERRQTAIGRGLMRDANLLLIDEPSLGLAPVIVEKVYEAIQEVARTTSVLLVEENFNHIESIADGVGVLEMGRIVRTGTATELLADAAVAQSYLGAEPTASRPDEGAIR